MIVGNDAGVRGNISKYKRDTRYKDSNVKDKLRLSLINYDIQRPRKEEWFEDDNVLPPPVLNSIGWGLNHK